MGTKATTEIVTRNFIVVKEGDFQVSVPEGGHSCFVFEGEEVGESTVVEVTSKNVPVLVQAIEDGKITLGDISRDADERDFEVYGVNTLEEFLAN